VDAGTGEEVASGEIVKGINGVCFPAGHDEHRRSTMARLEPVLD
jgi:hypothetical protein